MTTTEFNDQDLAIASSSIELPDVHKFASSSSSTAAEDDNNNNMLVNSNEVAPTQVESSMDIEQSVPTVAELRGKSDNEDVTTRPPVRRLRDKLFYAALALPFIVIGLIISGVIFAVSNDNSNSSGMANSLRDMDPDKSFVAVVEYLEKYDISEYPVLIREGSFQNLAAKWMAHDDPVHRRIPEGPPSSEEGYTFMQRYIMVLMYYQMGGPGWKYDFNFLSTRNTCEWFIWIVVEERDFPMGVQCNDDGFLTTLVMVDSNVKGVFPYELSELTTLTIIEMDVNEISGSFPVNLENLRSLQSLHLSHNKLTGSLPSYLGVFPDLLTIDVSFNLLEGSLPTELATMDTLRGVAIDHNLFTGNLNFWDEWSRPMAGYQQNNLEYIFLEHNAFGGPIEATMIEKLPNLKVFDASDNNFEGVIPEALFKMSKLLVIDLHDNQFTGPVPGGIPANTALRFLALHNNQLTGTVGESFGNLQTLEHLDLSNNQIRGYAINNNFGISSLTELTYLFLSANPFEAAEFPSWIQELTSLEELSLKSVKIAGTIPTWVGALSNLILLDLDDNDLRGSIPSELGNLTNLQFLLLNRNELTETVPAEITELRSLRLLYLEKNVVTGSLDSFCGGSSSTPIMVADCNKDAPEIECRCCTLCCKDTEPCNADNIVPSNDPLWQFGYDRLFYSFGNFTGSLKASP